VLDRITSAIQRFGSGGPGGAPHPPVLGGAASGAGGVSVIATFLAAPDASRRRRAHSLIA
jgi:hypothetical protein